MPPVTNKIKAPGGSLLTGRASITLVGDNADPVIGYVIGDDFTVVDTTTVDIVDGVWSVTLPPNSLITPSGTRYRVTEKVSDQTTSTYFINVRNEPGPFFVEAILSEPPASVASPALDAHIVSLDPHPTYALDTDVTAHVANGVAAHAASAVAFTPTGDLVATTVQAALAELDTEKARLINGKLDPAQSATNTVLDAAYSPLEPVRVQVEEELVGFRLIGYNHLNDIVYMLNDYAGQTIYSAPGSNLSAVAPLFQFSTTVTIRFMWTMASGTLLALVTKAGGASGDIWRSTDAGVTFAVALADIGDVSGLSRNLCQLPNGSIFLQEYTAVPSASTFRLRQSTDDGVTWTTLETYTNQQAHAHGVFSDTFVANRLWRAWGDTNASSKIEYADVPGGVLGVWTTIGSGDQTWRTVDLLFDATNVYMASDTADIPAAIYRYNRATGVRVELLDSGDTTLFYGVNDGLGHFGWVSGSFLAGDEVKLWVGRLDGLVRTTQALSATPLPATVRIDQHLYGPNTTTGRVYHSVANSQTIRRTSRTARCRLIDGDQAMTQHVALLDKDKVVAQNDLPVGPDPGPLNGATATTMALTNGREYLQQFVGPWHELQPITAISVMNGPTVANSLSLAIRASQADGSPGVLLAQSPLVAQSGVQVEQKHTLDKKVVLVPGVLYWLSLVSNNVGSGTVIGHGNVGFKTGQLRLAITASGGPVPVAAAAPVITTGGFGFSALLQTL